MDNQGISKGALGIRYLIKYFENGRVEDFKVVKDCIYEVQLWLIIIFYANNIDYLLNDIPDDLLSDIFLMKPIFSEPSEDSKEKAYGRGFITKSPLPFKEQFKLIRNALSHGEFSFKDNLIQVSIEGYEAVFDLIWLERLTTTLLSNNRYLLKKGMSDYSVISLIPGRNLNVSEMRKLIKEGSLAFYKITLLTSDKEKIKKAISIPDLDSKMITFNTLFRFTIHCVENHRVDIRIGIEEILKDLKNYFKFLEDSFDNAIKLELEPFELPEELNDNEEFNNLTYPDKLEYIISLNKEQDPLQYNTIMLYNLLQLLGEIDKDDIKKITFMHFHDSLPFLIKTYAIICLMKIGFLNLSEEDLKAYGIEASFVHAKSIYKDYLRILNRSLKELRENNGDRRSIEYILKQIKIYSAFLEEANANLAYKDLLWKIRNSIIHNHVEFFSDHIRFFTTGQNIKVRHFSKKKKEWEYKEFDNKQPIWEMTISIENFISFLDELFRRCGIETSVNISKYCKRSTYLK